MTLNDILNEFEELDYIEAEYGKDSEEYEQKKQMIDDTRECVVQDFIEKVNNYGQVINHKNAEVDEIDAEIKRLTARKKSINNQIDWLKSSVVYAMQKTNNPKIKTALYTFSLRDSQSVEITGSVPEPFLRYKDPEPDKTQIKQFLKENVCDWAQMKTNTSVTIR